MQRKIKNCPLIATLRNGNLFLFSHDVNITNDLFITGLTGETIANISIELYIKGIDIGSLVIDENRMNYATAEEMGW